MSAEVLATNRDLSMLLMDVAQAAAEERDVEARALAEGAIRRITTAHLRELAVRQVADWIEHFRRQKAREVEQAAKAARDAEAATAAREQEAKALTQKYDDYYADPTILDWGRAQSETGQPTVMLRAPERKRFCRWLGERYDEWYERGMAAVTAHQSAGGYGGSKATLFASDYWPGGSADWFAMRRLERVADLIHEVREETRLVVTEELLSTVFALGDGQRKTWGEATISDHEQRIEMLAKNAAGVIETAALHQAAIQMIRDAGVTSLAELAGEVQS